MTIKVSKPGPKPGVKRKTAVKPAVRAAAKPGPKPAAKTAPKKKVVAKAPAKPGPKPAVKPGPKAGVKTPVKRKPVIKKKVAAKSPVKRKVATRSKAPVKRESFIPWDIVPKRTIRKPAVKAIAHPKTEAMEVAETGAEMKSADNKFRVDKITSIQMSAFLIGWSLTQVLNESDDIFKPLKTSYILEHLDIGLKWAVLKRERAEPWGTRGPKPCTVCGRRFKGRTINCGDCMLLAKCPTCRRFHVVKSKKSITYCSNACRINRPYVLRGYNLNKKLGRHAKSLQVMKGKCSRHGVVWTSPHIGCMLCHYGRAIAKVKDYKFHHSYIEKITGLSVDPGRAPRRVPAQWIELFQFEQIFSYELYKQAIAMPSAPGVWAIWLGDELLDVAETIDIRTESMLFVRRLIHPDNMKYLQLRHRAGEQLLTFKLVRRNVKNKIRRQNIESKYAMKHRCSITVWSPAPGQTV